MVQQAEINQEQAEAFGGRVVGMINDASVILGVSVGHRTGLFDTLAILPPSTSGQIADAAGLNERYVREWLGAMVTGRIVEYDATTGRYRLPPEHAASLTRAAGTNNVAGLTQYFALMGNVEDELVECFRNGGGVPYSSFPNFQELQRQETETVYDATLIDVTLPMVTGLIEKLEAGIDVLDVGCGAGHAINVMARAFPKSRFTGYDFSDEGVRMGSNEAAAWGLTNARFEARDIATLDGSEQYDFITGFDIVHDQAKPRTVLKCIEASLKPGGTFLCVDMAASSNLEENVEHPLGPLLYTISYFHCMTVSLAQGGEGLGTVWGEQKARELFTEAGFTNIDVRHVEGDIFNCYYILRR